MGFSNDHIHRESINRQLTARQIQILELVSKGFTNPEICNFLQISTNTVKVHLANISLPSIHFYLDHSIVQHALAYRFFNGIAVGIQKFEDLKVLIHNEPCESSQTDFCCKCQIDFLDPDCFLIQVYHSYSPQILWSHSIQLHFTTDLSSILQKTIVQLHRAIEKSAAKLFIESDALKKHWWYAVMHSHIILERREQQTWVELVTLLTEFHTQHPNETLLKLHLANLWYKSIFEQWSSQQQALQCISDLANSSMRLDSDSQHTNLLFSIYSNVNQDYPSSQVYLEKCLEKNPLNLWVSQLLSQIYCFINKPKEGIELMARLKSFFPDFLLNNLLYITCLSHLNRLEEAKEQARLFTKNTPQFDSKRLGPLFNGIHPAPLQRLLWGAEQAGLTLRF